MVQALILAAGRGSRMGSYTHQTPKCMIPLARRPLIEWQLEAFRKIGIHQVLIITGYLSKKVCVNHAKILFYPNWKHTNMVGTLEYADAFLEKEDTIISYGDIVFHSSIIEKLLESPEEISLPYDTRWRALWEGRFDDPLTDAESFRIARSGKVIEIGKKTNKLDEIMGQFMGLLKLKKQGWKKIKQILNLMSSSLKKQMSTTTLLDFLIVKGVDVWGVPVQGRWCEVDQIEDIRYYEKKLDQGLHWFHDWRP